LRARACLLGLRNFREADGSPFNYCPAFLLSRKQIRTAGDRLPFSDRGDILKELLEAKGIVIGSSNINSSILPTVAPFLEELEGLRPRNKIAASFGSYGWGGGAVKAIEEKLKRADIEVVADALTVKWVPDKDELQKCFEFGR